MVNPMQFEFEKKLAELGLSYTINNDSYYTILNLRRVGNQITVRLLSSLSVDKQVYGSKNGNEVHSIGVFKFKYLQSGHDPGILGFTFHNLVKNRAEFLLVPSQEFLRRRFNKNPSVVSHKSIVVIFWVMEDECVYDTTNMSVEAEWYFMSKGLNCRLADRTAIDFSEFLNSWQRLIV